MQFHMNRRHLLGSLAAGAAMGVFTTAMASATAAGEAAPGKV